MKTYQFLGHTVTFTDAEENFYSLHAIFRKFIIKNRIEFKSWYQDCGDIQTVLGGYKNFALEHVAEYADVLFESLAHLEIYTVGENTFYEKCVSIKKVNTAYSDVEYDYEEILEELQDAKDYRAERKACRGRVQGGGFGVGGALKGMAAAGAMNAVSGATHSFVNCIGNVGSSISASSKKKSLYANENTFSILLNGILNTLDNILSRYTDFVNQYHSGFFEVRLKYDEAAALFENAKKFPQKREELLAKAFYCVPFYYAILSYAFLQFPQYRKELVGICNHFDVDITADIEKVLSAEVTDEMMGSPQLLTEAKKRVLQLMEEYGAEESETLDEINYTYLDLVCSGKDLSAWGTERKNVMEIVDHYDAPDIIRAAIVRKYCFWEMAEKYQVTFEDEEKEKILAAEYTEKAKTNDEDAMRAKESMQKIMEALHISQSSVFDQLERDCLARLCGDIENAEEAQCLDLIQKIDFYSALERNKNIFREKIDKRLYVIRSAEDLAAFEEVFVQTLPEDWEYIERNKEFLKQICRTDLIDSFLEAFSMLNRENIVMAAKYKEALDRNSFGAIFSIKKEGIYSKLTLGGRVFHPALLEAVECIKAGDEPVFAVFGDGYDDEEYETEAYEPEYAAPAKIICPNCGTAVSCDSAFCSECGAKLPHDFKFCSHCGTKLSADCLFCPECGTKQD